MLKTNLFVAAPDFPRDEHMLLAGGEYEESVALAHQLGYDGIELVAGDPDDVNADALESALRGQSMSIAAINSGGLNYVLNVSLVNADAAKERLAFRKLEALIRLAARFRCLLQIGGARRGARRPAHVGIPRPAGGCHPASL